MQVDSIKPKLKPPGTKRLKLNCETLLSTSAFNFNLRRYNKASVAAVDNADIIAAAAAVSAGAKAAIPPPPTSLAEAATTAIGQGLAASTYFITRKRPRGFKWDDSGRFRDMAWSASVPVKPAPYTSILYW